MPKTGLFDNGHRLKAGTHHASIMLQQLSWLLFAVSAVITLVLALVMYFVPHSGFLAFLFVLLVFSAIIVQGVLSRYLQSEVNQNLGQLFDGLEDSNSKLNYKIQLASAVGELAPRLQAATDFTSLADSFLCGLASYLKIGQGSFYILDSDGQKLQLCSGFARVGGVSPPEIINPGDGLVGECALQKKMILLDKPPSNYLYISSALAEVPPANLLFLPILANERLLGVIELALLAPVTAEELNLVNEMLPPTALCLEVLERSLRTTQLLQESRKQAEELAAQQEVITQNEARTKQILEDSPAAVTMLSEDGEFLFANRRLANLLHMPRENLKKFRLKDFWGNSHDWEHYYDKLQKQGSVSEYEANLKRVNGSNLWVLLNTRWMEQDGKHLLLTWMYDITERKLAEEAMLRAQHLAEDAARTKTDFLANMSHEIRTPMNTIIGMAYLALKTELSPIQQDYIRKIRNSGQHLLGIIDDILDLSKIEAGKMDIEQISFNIERLQEDIEALMAAKADAKGLQLSFSIANDLPLQLIGDRLRISQILINYINNAIKFTEQGSITVYLDYLEKTETDLLLYCEVKDSGIGLTDEQIELLFRSFQQADTSTTRKYGGTGLGLAISKNLAELMGGEVGVKSVYGQGSSFWFTARVGISHVTCLDDDGDYLYADTAQTLNLDGLQGVRVLLVEDNQLNQEVAGAILGEAGLIVDIAENGKEALDMVAAHKADHWNLLLMDMQMPVMDGLTATRNIRKLVGYEKLPIIAMTANAMQQDKERCLAAGMVDFISKPFRPEELWSILHRWTAANATDGVVPLPDDQPAQKQALVTQDKPDAAAMPELEELPAGLIDIEGLDVATSLQYLAGLPNLASVYLSMLHKFVVGQGNSAAEISAALAAADYPAAERIAHSLKGTAATVGATAIQEKASALEAAIRKKTLKDGQADEQLSELSAMLAAFIKAVEAVLPPEKEQA